MACLAATKSNCCLMQSLERHRWNNNRAWKKTFNSNSSIETQETHKKAASARFSFHYFLYLYLSCFFCAVFKTETSSSLFSFCCAFLGFVWLNATKNLSHWFMLVRRRSELFMIEPSAHNRPINTQTIFWFTRFVTSLKCNRICSMLLIWKIIAFKGGIRGRGLKFDFQ